MLVPTILGLCASFFTGFVIFMYFTLVQRIQKARRINERIYSFCYPRLRSEAASDPAARDYYLPDEHVDFRKADRLFEASLPPPTGQGYVIVGGSGFVGSYLCRSLIQRGETYVVNIDLRPPTIPGHKAVRFIKSDITDPEQLEQAFDEAVRVFGQYGVKLTTVIMTAAIIRYQDSFSWQLPLSRKINVNGTANVIRAITRPNSTVRHFIQTSTSHVVLGFDNHGYNLTEETPYTKKPFNHYQRTKIEAEKLVLAANNTPIPGSGHRLLTAVVRPCTGIFGAYDSFCIGVVFRNTILKRPIQTLIGGEYSMDWIYVENLSLGFQLLEQAMRKDPTSIAGQIFNISNNEIVQTADLDRRMMYFYPKIRPLLCLHPVHSSILAKIADIGQFLDTSLGDLDLFSSAAWNMTQINSGFTCVKAKKLLGYRPIYTIDQAIQKSFAILDGKEQLK